MSSQKIVVLVVWVASALASLFAGGIISTIGTVLISFLVVAHAIECIVFRKELADAPGGMGAHLGQVFLFGIVHMQELRAGSSGDDA